MELRELAKRTGQSFRTVRYVVEHEIVPRSNVAFRGRGSVQPRLFTDETGILIACAASLLDGGIKRSLVEKIIDSLRLIELRISRRKTVEVFYLIADDDCGAKLEIGDNQWVRVVIEPPDAWDSGWLDLGSLEKVAETRRPAVVVCLDVGLIRDRVIGDRAEQC